MIPKPRAPKPTRHYSRKQELGAAKKLGMKTTPNSGATPMVKGDLISERALLECKTMMKPQKQVTLKKEWFTTIRKEQFEMRKEISGILFDFGDGTNYVAIPEDDFKRFLNYIEGDEML